MKIFLDCGTHLGDGIKQHVNLLGIDESWVIHSFEANPITYGYLADVLDKIEVKAGFEFFRYKNLHLYNLCVWVNDEKVKFYCARPEVSDSKDPAIIDYYAEHRRKLDDGDYLTSHEETGLSIDGSSSMFGKRMRAVLGRTGNEFQRTLKWDREVSVNAFDFSKYIFGLPESEYLYCKLDVEGAEFKILRHLIKTGAIKKLDGISVEWHHYNNLYLRFQKLVIKTLVRVNKVHIIDWH